MNDVIENMITRRSVRKYKNDMISKEILDEIIKAGMYAPTSCTFIGDWKLLDS